MKLKKIVNMISGSNNQRLKEQIKASDIYSADDLDYDLAKGYNSTFTPTDNKDQVAAGDIVLHLMSGQTAVVSTKNAGKYISQRTAKLEVDRKQIDPWYLCYVLNESTSVEHQTQRLMEGTVIKRVTRSNALSLDIKLPPIEKQRLLGNIYRKSLMLYHLQKEQAKKVHSATLAIIKQFNPNN